MWGDSLNKVQGGGPFSYHYRELIRHWTKSPLWSLTLVPRVGRPGKQCPCGKGQARACFWACMILKHPHAFSSACIHRRPQPAPLFASCLLLPGPHVSLSFCAPGSLLPFFPFPPPCHLHSRLGFVLGFFLTSGVGVPGRCCGIALGPPPPCPLGGLLRPLFVNYVRENGSLAQE